MKPMFCMSLFLMLVLATPIAAQPNCLQTLAKPGASPLPTPTGRFKVGRMSYHLGTDAKTDVGSSPAELMVYVWYPVAAKVVGNVAPYIPGWTLARDTVLDSLKRAVGESYAPFEPCGIPTHAVENGRVADGNERFPVLLFSHGLGVAALTYASQVEDLASHGYVVAAMEYTPATARFVTLPDGRFAPYDAERWNPKTSSTEERVEWEKGQLDQLATSFRVALSELTRLGRTRGHVLRNRLDLSRIGVFGHSFGAMGALRVAQLDQRLRAALIQDGFGPGMMAHATGGHAPMKVPFALMFRPIPPQSTTMRENLPRLYRALPDGSIWMTVAGPDMEHMSFSDLPILRAGQNPAKLASALRNITIVREFTRRFFDVHLRDASPPSLISGLSNFPEIAIEGFSN